jgi:hypothetical protein
MFSRRNRHSFAAWIACFAILIAALAPTVSHFLGEHGLHLNAGLQADRLLTAMVDESVCHSPETVGATQQEANTPADPAPHEPTLHAEHCPYCLNHSLALGPQAHKHTVFPALPQLSERPPLFYRSTLPLAIWASAQPRGPPRIV